MVVWSVRKKSSAASISGSPGESGLLAMAIFPSGFPVENNGAAPDVEGQHKMTASKDEIPQAARRRIVRPITSHPSIGFCAPSAGDRIL
jgi:hypothetical protein